MKRRPVDPDDLIGLGLALGVLAPQRRARPTRQVARQAALHVVLGAVVLAILFGALVILV